MLTKIAREFIIDQAIGDPYFHVSVSSLWFDLSMI